MSNTIGGNMISCNSRRMLDYYLKTNSTYSFSEEIYNNLELRVALEKIKDSFVKLIEDESKSELSVLSELEQIIVDEFGKSSIMYEEIQKCIESLNSESQNKVHKHYDNMLKILGAIDIDRRQDN